MQTEGVGSKKNQMNKVQEDEMTMAELLETSIDLQPLERGTIINGTVVSIGDNELLVNVGSKYEGIVKAKDLERVDDELLASLKVGDKIPVYVIHLADEEGYVLLSLNKAVIEQDWEKAQEFFESGEILELEVISSNKGGLIVNFGSVRGFVPGSQLDTIHISGSDKGNQWSNLTGKTLKLKIIEVDRRRNRLILSERVAVEEVRQQIKESMIEELTEGEVLKGVRVTSLADFGAFVDLGGAEGLIHLSELSWAQISHPREILKVGNKIDVYILNIDYERQRIGLSLKRLEPEPWSQALDNYQPGQIVSAVITKLTNFGAFARIDNLLEGLIHISELSEKQINHPREVVSEGDEVEVRIISIEPERRRMGLSLKQVAEPETLFEQEEDEPTAGSPEETEVDTSTDNEETDAPQAETSTETSDEDSALTETKLQGA
jgi:small subunit ribosomal protein S1